MAIHTLLFDLDGTLLPMDQEVFMHAYFGGLCKKLAPHGYDPEKVVDGIWKGTAAMVKNDGSQTNEEAFWQVFCAIHGEKARLDEPIFDDYYHREFQQVEKACMPSPMAAECVRRSLGRGLRVALATNPLFPAIATQSRIRWAGLNEGDFALVTTYENARHCKPNPAYYQDVLDALGAKPEECAMVGNDVGEDMVAAKLGMRVFLLTDCLINRKNEDISVYPHGGFAELLEWIDRL